MILFNTSGGIYSIPKESKYKTTFLSINTQMQCAFLLFLSLRFITHTSSFILGKLFLEKTPFNLDSYSK